MAIDDKFISANISKDVVDQMNRPRRRKRRGPRPWDKKVSLTEPSTPVELDEIKESESGSDSLANNQSTIDAQSAHGNGDLNYQSDYKEQIKTPSERHISPEKGLGLSEGKDTQVFPTTQPEVNEKSAHNQRSNDAQSAHNKEARLNTNQRSNDIQTAHENTFKESLERTNSAQQASSKSIDVSSEASRLKENEDFSKTKLKPNKRTISAESERSPELSLAHRQRTNSAQNTGVEYERVNNQRSISAQDVGRTGTSKKANRHTISAPSTHNQHTNNVQSTHIQNTDRAQSTLNQSTVQRTKERTNDAQNNLRSDYYVLSGQELKFLQLVFNKCLISGSLVSTPVTNLEVATFLGSKKSSVRTVIKRVVDKDFLSRVESKSGKGGWTKFGMSSDLYQKLLLDKQGTSITNNSAQQEHKQRTIERTVERTNLSSSSSNLNNNTNTNYEEKNELSGEWSEIITPELLKEINFGKTQLLQLKRVGGLSPEEVQDSLDAFAYDLEAGKVKSFGSKLGFLMGILRKGNSYISEAYMNEMRAAYERQKALREEKQRLEKQQVEERLSKKAKEEYEKLSDDQKMELVPENNLAKVNSQVHERMVLAKLIESMGQKESGHGKI